jgi:DNA-directed RNA polymerase subunit K/omega
LHVIARTCAICFQSRNLFTRLGCVLRLVSAMDETVQTTEQFRELLGSFESREGRDALEDMEALIPAEPAEPIHSRFLFVDVAALRAKQLRKGARPRLGDDTAAHVPHKAERLAMEEVRRGLVQYDVPSGRSGQEAEP